MFQESHNVDSPRRSGSVARNASGMSLSGAILSLPEEARYALLCNHLVINENVIHLGASVECLEPNVLFDFIWAAFLGSQGHSDKR
jgi:hypothetical protein